MEPYLVDHPEPLASTICRLFLSILRITTLSIFKASLATSTVYMTPKHLSSFPITPLVSSSTTVHVRQVKMHCILWSTVAHQTIPSPTAATYSRTGLATQHNQIATIPHTRYIFAETGGTLLPSEILPATCLPLNLPCTRCPSMATLACSMSET